MNIVEEESGGKMEYCLDICSKVTVGQGNTVVSAFHQLESNQKQCRRNKHFLIFI